MRRTKSTSAATAEAQEPNTWTSPDVKEEYEITFGAVREDQSIHGPTPTAGCDDHANAALADRESESAEERTVLAHVNRLRLEIQVLEGKVGSGNDDSVNEMVCDLNQEIERICSGTDGWLAPDVKMDGIYGYRAIVAEKREMIRRLKGLSALEAKRSELTELLEEYPVFAHAAAPVESTKPPVEKPATQQSVEEA